MHELQNEGYAIDIPSVKVSKTSAGFDTGMIALRIVMMQVGVNRSCKCIREVYERNKKKKHYDCAPYSNTYYVVKHYDCVQ